MSPVLVVLNLAALMFSAIVLFSLSKTYRLIFLSAMVLPMALWFIVAFVTSETSWGITEVIMMILRGSFILGVISGTLACYFVTKFKS